MQRFVIEFFGGNVETATESAMNESTLLSQRSIGCYLARDTARGKKPPYTKLASDFHAFLVARGLRADWSDNKALKEVDAASLEPTIKAALEEVHRRFIASEAARYARIHSGETGSSKPEPKLLDFIREEISEGVVSVHLLRLGDMLDQAFIVGDKILLASVASLIEEEAIAADLQRKKRFEVAGEDLRLEEPADAAYRKFLEGRVAQLTGQTSRDAEVALGQAIIGFSQLPDDVRLSVFVRYCRVLACETLLHMAYYRLKVEGADEMPEAYRQIVLALVDLGFLADLEWAFGVVPSARRALGIAEALAAAGQIDGAVKALADAVFLDARVAHFDLVPFPDDPKCEPTAKSVWMAPVIARIEEEKPGLLSYMRREAPRGSITLTRKRRVQIRKTYARLGESASDHAGVLA
jgi:hypothetical protein